MNRLLTFLGSEAGLKTAGIIAAVLAVTSAASVNSVKHRENSALTEPSASDDASLGALPSETLAPATSSGATNGKRVGSTGGVTGPKAPSNVLPPALRGIDFGLKTQGITDKEVKVGFSANFDNCGDTATLVQQFGPLIGDPKKAIDTFARYVNDQGGIGGRKYKPVYVEDGGSGCPDRNMPAAIKMADQDKVFLAVPGLHVESDYIIKRGIPVWGGRDDPDSLAKYGPNGFQLLEPIGPTVDAWASFGKYWLGTTDKTGKEPACLIRISNGASGNWDYAQLRLREQMANHGIRFIDEYTFQDDVSTAQSQSDAIVRREKNKGCQHVYFLAGNPVGLIFFTNAATKNRWFPHKWTWTGYTALSDDDKIGNAMDPVQWANAEGLTYRLPAGVSPYDGNCKKIYEKYVPDDGNGDSASVKLACGTVLPTAEMMRRGLKLTGKLDANAFVIGANAVKDDFFFDATVPMDFSIPDRDGPFKTRGFSHYTVAKWDSANKRYAFPAYPCYYRTFGPNKAGCEDLRRFYSKK